MSYLLIVPIEGLCDIEHDWQLIDDSFDHQFGTEQIFYYQCNNCGSQREAEHEDFYFEDFN